MIRYDFLEVIGVMSVFFSLLLFVEVWELILCCFVYVLVLLLNLIYISLLKVVWSLSFEICNRVLVGLIMLVLFKELFVSCIFNVWLEK